jgi:hypothetical protein
VKLQIDKKSLLVIKKIIMIGELKLILIMVRSEAGEA